MEGKTLRSGIQRRRGSPKFVETKVYISGSEQPSKFTKEILLNQ